MNYDLAMMALEGLARSPLVVRVEGDEVWIEARASAFKELARLCLLLGGDATGGADGFELKPGFHTTAGGRALQLRLIE